MDDIKQVTYYKKDFWIKENPKYITPHYRLEKSARVVNKVAGNGTRTLLDIGCGPATLKKFLNPDIRYHGIDIAIQEPSPDLLEADILESPIRFGEMRFDIVVAQGLFEYLGDRQDQKFSEITQLMNSRSTFLVSYVNFDHRRNDIYWPYNNVQPFERFRRSLAQHFIIKRYFPTSLNWNHLEPSRRSVRAVNMHMNVNIPLITSKLAVEYFFICSPRHDQRG